MFRRRKPSTILRPVLSPAMQNLWGYVPMRHLVIATDNFVVFLDDKLAVDWKTTPEWDIKNRNEKAKWATVLNRAAALESGDWDGSDDERTLNLRRQIAEGIARCFDCDYPNAEYMLTKAEEYRNSMMESSRRRQAIRDQVLIKDEWRRYYKWWNGVHYFIGISALFLSSLVAAKPAAIGLNESGFSLFAWLVAFSTGLLTFLTPDKKAGKYARAWSILNSQITRYNADNSYTVDDILDACRQGENIISETSPSTNRRTK